MLNLMIFVNFIKIEDSAYSDVYIFGESSILRLGTFDFGAHQNLCSFHKIITLFI